MEDNRKELEEWFKAPGGRLLLKYLQGRVDQYKDKAHKAPTWDSLVEIRGRIDELESVIGDLAQLKED